jgi:hypothetical protein
MGGITLNVTSAQAAIQPTPGRLRMDVHAPSVCDYWFIRFGR